MRLRDFFQFGPPKGKPFGISAQFYLSVITSRGQLPSLNQIIDPKFRGDAVAGYGVPLNEEADPTALDDPLDRGGYGITTLDKKTALMMWVGSKEEQQFDPQIVLDSSFGEGLSQEIRHRLAASWHVIQLSFRSHDPEVLPAMQFILSVARRLARLTEGVIADPMRRTYQLSEDYEDRPQFFPPDHLSVAREENLLQTHGLVKFGLVEMGLVDVPHDLDQVAAKLLLGYAGACLEEEPLKPNDMVGSDRTPMKFTQDGLLVPKPPASVQDCLLAWQDELSPEA